MGRLLTTAVLTVAALAAAAPLQAQTPRPTGPEPSRPEGARSTLDDLFGRLAAAKDENEAKGVANLIERRWARSGSDTADLLASRAVEALRAKDAPLAIELLDRVIALQPDWAEAWNRRAQAFHALEDPVSALADIRQVLAREPRHYGAWTGLGHIMMASGDKRRAVEAYRKALAIHPHLEAIKNAVERLSPEVDGRDI